MRNLKKVLSLALALVMLLGMMVVGASAAETKYADLTDNGEIVNAEAVTLMVDLGIIKGIEQEDGTFKYQPADTVNRATMAKLVYYIKLGNTDTALFKNMNTGLEDVAGHWAEGEINYCYSTGLIAGDGQGHFFPDLDVNVVAAAKMLLTALGYDAANRGYQGVDNWAINVMLDAQNNGLTAGLPQSLVADADLSRDNAAQMVYNALNARTVTPTYSYGLDGTRFVTGYATGDTLGYNAYGMIKVTASVSAIDNDGNIVMSAATAEGKNVLTAVNSKVKMAGTADMVGGTVTFYIKGTLNKDNTGAITSVAVDSAISSEVTKGAANVLYTSTDGSTITALTSGQTKKVDLEANPTATETKETVTYYVNGDSSTGNPAKPYGNGTADPKVQAYSASVAANSTADVASAVVKGSTVEFIDTNSNGLADVIRITNKTVGTVSADPATRVSGGKDQVRVPGVVGAWTDAAKVVGWEDLKKDDVVLYYTNAGITYIEKAASIEGVATGVRGTSPLVNGEYLEVSGLANASMTWSNNFKDNFTYFLDDAGYVVACKSDAPPPAAAQYAVVLKTSWVAGSTDLTQQNTQGFAQAQLLMTDGTTKVVTVTKYGDAIPATANASASGGQPAKIQWNDSTPVITGKFVAVSEKPNGCELTLVDVDAAKNISAPVTVTAYASGTKSGLSVTKGAAQMAYNESGATASDGTKVTVNANTIFLVKTAGAPGQPDTYTAYVGNANVPSLTKGAAEYFEQNGVAKVVYITGAEGVATAASEYVYIPSNAQGGITYNGVPKKDGNGVAYYEVAAIIDGETTTLKVAANSGNVVDGSSPLAPDTLYTATTKNDDDAVTAFATVSTTANVSLGGNVLQVGGTPYATTEDTTILRITADGTVETIAWNGTFADKTDEAKVEETASESGIAKLVYIVEVVDDDVTLASTKTYTIADSAAAALTLDDTKEGTQNDPKLLSMTTVSNAAKDKDVTVQLSAHSAGAKIELISTTPNGQVMKTPNADSTKMGGASGVVLLYMVTAENGDVCYYQVTLDITTAAGAPPATPSVSAAITSGTPAASANLTLTATPTALTNPTYSWAVTTDTNSIIDSFTDGEAATQAVSIKSSATSGQTATLTVTVTYDASGTQDATKTATVTITIP